MTRYVGYIAMSLDARIADGEGGLDWLIGLGMPGELQTGYDTFYAGVDALVMGRSTYDWIRANHDWTYAGKPSYVVTSRPFEADRDDIVPVGLDYPALAKRLREAGHETVWILGGGMVQRAALEAGMFETIRVFVVPFIVGSGPLIFADGPLRKIALKTSRTWPEGIVELEYELGNTA